MDMNINIKELCKQIKKSRSIIWIVKGGVQYVTNRHWAVKYTELPREVLIQLFSVFAEIPGEEQTLNYDKTWGVTRRDAVAVDKLFDDQSKETSVGEVTPYLKLNENFGNLRIIKAGKEVVYVNEDYMKMVKDFEKSYPVCSTAFRPVSFNDNTLIILPVRVGASKDDVVIKELLAS